MKNQLGTGVLGAVAVVVVLWLLAQLVLVVAVIITVVIVAAAACRPTSHTHRTLCVRQLNKHFCASLTSPPHWLRAFPVPKPTTATTKTTTASAKDTTKFPIQQRAAAQMK